MKELPKEITVCKLDCILMPQGEVLCLGKTVGWFKDLKPYLEKDEAAAPKGLNKHKTIMKLADKALKSNEVERGKILNQIGNISEQAIKEAMEEK